MYVINIYRFVIEHCLKCYGDRLDDNIDPSDKTGEDSYSRYYYNVCNIIIIYLVEVYYELSEDKVCQFYAELLLRPAGKVSKSFYFLCSFC